MWVESGAWWEMYQTPYRESFSVVLLPVNLLNTSWRWRCKKMHIISQLSNRKQNAAQRDARLLISWIISASILRNLKMDFLHLQVMRKLSNFQSKHVALCSTWIHTAMSKAIRFPPACCFEQNWNKWNGTKLWNKSTHFIRLLLETGNKKYAHIF